MPRNRPMQPRPNRRPITRPVPADGQESARRALLLVEEGIRSMVGTDDDPSGFWDALAMQPGVDADGMELAQDSALLAADILEAIRDGVGQPPATMALTLAAVVMAAAPEIAGDVKAIQS
jgi:hypothetical protein